MTSKLYKKKKKKKKKTWLKKEQIIKNADELYKKYYETYKSDYDTDDKINGTKKKNFHYKQFELVNKTDKELKLDEETNNFIK